MHRFYSLNAFFRSRFGHRVQKIPLDAGFNCPNRDGAISHAGCVFCNPAGSGSGMMEQGMPLTGQWNYWRNHMHQKKGVKFFAAYLQSYSNTYGPIHKLQTTLNQLQGLTGLVALSIGTRPDCLDEQKLDLLAEQKQKLGLGEVFIELGLQSASNKTLAHINRGHTVEDFIWATEAASARGLNVVAHIIAGLPSPKGREGKEELLQTVQVVAQNPVGGVKIHNLYVCTGTQLARQWKNNAYTPLTREEYCDWLGEALMLLPTHMVIHRLNGDPAAEELLAPAWAGQKGAMLRALQYHLQESDIWQGRKNGAPNGPPAHFNPDHKE